MIGFIKKLRRRRSIKAFVHKISPSLIKRYGRSDRYTVGQIQTTIEHLGLPSSYAFVGYAMYLDEIDFNQWNQQTSDPQNYQQTRQDISNICFMGRTEFSSWAANGYDSTGGFDVSHGSNDGGGAD